MSVPRRRCFRRPMPRDSGGNPGLVRPQPSFLQLRQNGKTIPYLIIISLDNGIKRPGKRAGISEIMNAFISQESLPFSCAREARGDERKKRARGMQHPPAHISRISCILRFFAFLFSPRLNRCVSTGIYTILNLKSYHLWVSFPPWRCFIPVNAAVLRLPPFSLARAKNPSQI